MVGRYCTWVHRAGKGVCIDLPLPDGKCKAMYIHTYSTYITECLIDKIYLLIMETCWRLLLRLKVSFTVRFVFPLYLLFINNY